VKYVCGKGRKASSPKLRICRIVLCLFLAAIVPLYAHASFEVSFDNRQQLRARYILHICVDAGDTLTCLSSKGFSCEPVSDNGVETYFCQQSGKSGRFEGTISYSQRGWTGRMVWVPDGVEE